jgi:hypothetical protein
MEKGAGKLPAPFPVQTPEDEWKAYSVSMLTASRPF